MPGGVREGGCEASPYSISVSLNVKSVPLFYAGGSNPKWPLYAHFSARIDIVGLVRPGNNSNVISCSDGFEISDARLLLILSVNFRLI